MPARFRNVRARSYGDTRQVPRRTAGRPAGLRLVSACAFGLALTVISPAGSANAQAEATAPDKALYAKGKSSFRKRCARCHGVNMVNPGAGIFDLRNFPPDEQARFIESVTYGKNAMPSWQDVLGPEDIEALWIYVSGGSAPASP
jgi:mono/diheme cytochrome c family protein